MVDRYGVGVVVVKWCSGVLEYHHRQITATTPPTPVHQPSRRYHKKSWLHGDGGMVWCMSRLLVASMVVSLVVVCVVAGGVVLGAG